MRMISNLDRLVAANIAAKMASGIHEFVFIILLLKVSDGDLFFAGVLFLLRSLPFFVLGPISGLFADTLSRKHVLIFCDVARSLAGIGCIVALSDDLVGPPLVVLYGALMASMHAFYAPAYSSAIKDLADPKKLVRANSAIQIASETGLMIGPFIGAIAMGGEGAVDYKAPIACGCILYIVSAGIIQTIKLTRSPEKAHAGTSITKARVASTYRKFYVFGNIDPPVVGITIFYSSICIALIAGIISIVVPQLVLQNHGSEQIVGFVMGALSAGTIIGALVCSRVKTKHKVVSLMTFWIAYGIVLGMVNLTFGSVVTVCAWALLLGIVGAFIDIYIPTIIQEQSDPASIGNNFSLFSTSANLGEAASGLLVGLTVLVVGIDSISAVIGGLVVLLAVTGRIRLIRKPETTLFE